MKIKLEDTCLTVEQAKELQALGVDMKDSLMQYRNFYNRPNMYELLDRDSISSHIVYDTVNTLTNTEMMEILPKFETSDLLVSNGELCHTIYRLNIIVVDELYNVQYLDRYNHIAHLKDINNTHHPLTREDIAVSVGKYSLRDALFNMIKFLKTNKII